MTTRALYVAFHKPTNRYNLQLVERDGKKKKASSLGYFATKEEADHERKEQAKNLGIIVSVEPQKQTLPVERCIASIFPEVVKEREGERESLPNWKRQYTLHIATHPIAFIPLEKLTRKDCQLWANSLAAKVSERTKRPLSRQSMINIHSVLASILSYAARMTWIDGAMVTTEKGTRWATIGSNLGLPERKATDSHKEYNALTFEELQRVIACKEIDLKYRHLFKLAAYTGLRSGEIEALEIEDLHLEASPPFLILKKQKNKKKNQKLFLLLPAVEAIKGLQALQMKGGDKYLFPNEKGEKHCFGWCGEFIREIGKVPGIVGELPGLPWKFHSLRATYSGAIKGGELAILADEERRLLVRHADIRTTRTHYEKNDERVRKAAVERINASLAAEQESDE